MPAITLADTAAVRFSLPAELAKQMHSPGGGSCDNGEGLSSETFAPRSVSESCVSDTAEHGENLAPSCVGRKMNIGRYVNEIRRLARTEPRRREFSGGGGDDDVGGEGEESSEEARRSSSVGDVDASQNDCRWEDRRNMQKNKLFYNHQLINYMYV
jgi:hypothetical protein